MRRLFFSGRRYPAEQCRSGCSRERHSPRCREHARACDCIVAADRHIDLVRDRVSRHRMRAYGDYGFQVRVRRRSGVYNAQQLRGAIGNEVMTIAGLEPDFVSPALPLKVSGDGPGLKVDDQAARVGKLFIKAEEGGGRAIERKIIFRLAGLLGIDAVGKVLACLRSFLTGTGNRHVARRTKPDLGPFAVPAINEMKTRGMPPFSETARYKLPLSA
jgi:hypothetical protein